MHSVWEGHPAWNRKQKCLVKAYKEFYKATLLFSTLQKKLPYRWKKKPVKSAQFFSGDQYFSSTNSFTQLKLTPTKNVYQLFFFLLNKNQITEILKSLQSVS